MQHLTSGVVILFALPCWGSREQVPWFVPDRILYKIVTSFEFRGGQSRGASTRALTTNEPVCSQGLIFFVIFSPFTISLPRYLFVASWSPTPSYMSKYPSAGVLSFPLCLGLTWSLPDSAPCGYGLSIRRFSHPGRRPCEEALSVTSPVYGIEASPRCASGRASGATRTENPVVINPYGAASR